MSRETNIPLSPEETYRASELFGSSLFSAIQLAKEMDKLKKGKIERETGPGDVLRIPIPMSHMGNKTAEEDDTPTFLGRAIRFNRHPIRMLVGGQSGFREARQAFHRDEKKEIEKQLMDAQKEYMSTLERIKVGSCDDTPYVDAYCNGMLQNIIFEKEAADAEHTNISDNALRRLAGDMGRVAKKPFQPAIDAASTGLMSTAAGTAYLTYLLKKKMREEPENYLEEEMPTRVELQPY